MALAAQRREGIPDRPQRCAPAALAQVVLVHAGAREDRERSGPGNALF